MCRTHKIRLLVNGNSKNDKLAMLVVLMVVVFVSGTILMAKTIAIGGRLPLVRCSV